MERTTMNDENNSKDLSMESSHSDHCDKCHSDFDDFDQFVGHKCPSSPFLCSVCSENFDFDYQLNIHMKTAHDSEASDSKALDPKVDCEICKSSPGRPSVSSNSEMEDNYDDDEGTDSLLGRGRDSKMDCKGEETSRHALKRKAVEKNLEIEKRSKPRKRRRGESESDSTKDVVTVSCEQKQLGENANSLGGGKESASLATLTRALPDNECAVLLQSQQPTNNFKCAKCQKTFRSYKLAATHYTNCKCNRSKKNVLAFNEVRWVCTHCSSLFMALFDFLKHKRICSNSSVQIGSLKRNLLATVKESLSKSYVPFNKGCPDCYQSSTALCQNEECQKLLKYMASCMVCIRKLPFIDVQSGAYLYECRDCKIVFTDNRLYLKHVEGTHNSVKVPQGKPLLLPPTFKAARSIKREMPSPEAVASAEPPPLGEGLPSADDPPSFIAEILNILLCGEQDKEQPQPGTSSQSANGLTEQENYSIMNLLLCSCNPKKCGSLCTECVSDSNIPHIPPELIQFSRELSQNVSTSTLTPPVSHTGFTPPSTPDAKRAGNYETENSLAFEPACSPICEEGGKAGSNEEDCMDEIQVDPDPEQEKASSAEIPPPEICMEIVRAEHDCDVDAYAVVSPTDPNHVQEYICFCCLDSHDANSLSKHLRNTPHFSRDVIKALHVEVNHDPK